VYKTNVKKFQISDGSPSNPMAFFCFLYSLDNCNWDETAYTLDSYACYHK